MKISTFIPSIIFFLLTTTLQGQSKNGFSYMNQGNLDDSERSFRKGQQDSGDLAASSLGIGLLFGDASFKHYHLDSAYIYLKDYPLYWTQLNKKDKKYLEGNKVNETTLQQALAKVIEEAFQKATNSKEAAEQVHYLEFYDLADEEKKNKVFQRKHELLYQSVKSTNTLDAYRDFLAKNENDLLAYSKNIYLEAHKAVLDLFLAENGWDTFSNYEKLFPSSPYVSDLGKNTFLTLKSNNPSNKISEFENKTSPSSNKEIIDQFNNFISTNTESLFIPYVQKQLEVIEFASIKNSTDMDAIVSFLKKYKGSSFATEIDTKLSNLLNGNLQISTFEKYRKSIQLSDIPKTIEVIYSAYADSGYPKRLEDFIKKYPSFKENVLFKADETLVMEYKKLPLKYSQVVKSQYSAYIKKAAPKQSAFTSLQKMLAPSIKDGNWEAALATTQAFKDVFGENNAAFNNLRTILSSPVLANIRKQSLAGQTNTENSEYSPVISVDEKNMFFCRRIGTKESIFAASKNGIEWDNGEKIETLVGRGNRAPLGISADGTQLLIFENGRINVATKTSDGWNSPKPIGKQINNSKWQGGATFSSDDKVLIFAARRTDVLGVEDIDNIDLFVSFKGPDENWQLPINIGKQINTSFKERSPFLHPDLRTLYFSSDAHGGLGGMDVYMTTRLDNSWLEWSEPINLGKMINTAGDDWGYSISTDGKIGYFATNESGANHQDIFTVTIPEEFRPGEVSTVGGKLVDTKGAPIEADITIEDLDEQKPVAELRTDPSNGSYFAVLPEKRLYGYVIEKDGFYPASGFLDLRKNNYSQKINNDFTLYTFDEAKERNLALPISNLFFETGKAIIKNSSHSALNRLARLIIGNDLKINVEGHTDNVGSDATNLKLSNERASAIKSYLLNQGVGSTSILSEGFGESSPIAPNETEDGRAQNRRVEIRLKKG